MQRRMPARSLIRVALTALAALAIGGCVEFSAPPEVEQLGDAGNLRLTIPICSGDGACGPVDNDTEARLLVAVELPDELAVPAAASVDLPTPVDASDGTTYVSTSSLQLERNAHHESQFAAAHPPAAGSRWVVWVSPQFLALGTISYHGSIELDLPLDRADDGTTADLLEWRVVSDYLASGGPDHGDAATSTTPCSVTDCLNARHPASGAREQFTPRVLVAKAPTPTTVEAGTTERLQFGLELTGGALPAPGTVEINANTNLAGATATPVVEVVEPINGSTVPVEVDFTVPASAVDGATATIVLASTTAGGEVRRASTTVTVAATRPTVPAERVEVPAYVPSARVVRTQITRRCFRLGRPAHLTFRYELTTDARVTFELHRRVLRRPLRGCYVQPERRPRFRVIARRHERNVQGERALQLRRLVNVSRLGVGSYRLMAKTRYANGVVESRSIQSFVVARR